MKIIASAQATQFINSRGGQLWVWPHHHRCCYGAFTLLDSSVEPPRAGAEFDLIDAGSFSLHLDAAIRRRPEELVLELKGWQRKRIETYWNGCAYVENT